MCAFDGHAMMSLSAVYVCDHANVQISKLRRYIIIMCSDDGLALSSRRSLCHYQGSMGCEVNLRCQKIDSCDTVYVCHHRSPLHC